MSRVAFMYLWIALLPGCSTMDMLKTAGKGYMDGEFGMATTALALAPLMLVPDAIDVVTLGAASRPRERSAEPVESSGQTSAMLGSLLQVAGQAAQASGPGQGYESGVLMAGVGAALAGDNVSAKQIGMSQGSAYSAGMTSLRTDAQVSTAIPREKGWVYRDPISEKCVYVSPPNGPGNSHQLLNKCGYEVTVFVCYQDSGNERCAEGGGAGTHSIKLTNGEQGYVVFPQRPLRAVVCKHSVGNYWYYPNVVYSAGGFSANCRAPG